MALLGGVWKCRLESRSSRAGGEIGEGGGGCRDPLEWVVGWGQEGSPSMTCRRSDAAAAEAGRRKRAKRTAAAAAPERLDTWFVREALGERPNQCDAAGCGGAGWAGRGEGRPSGWGESCTLVVGRSDVRWVGRWESVPEGRPIRCRRGRREAPWSSRSEELVGRPIDPR